MKIPKKIKFLGHTIRVEMASPKAMTDDGYCKGSYDFKKGVIKLDKTLRDDEKGEVFFHEIAEMLAYYLDVQYSDFVGHRGFSRCITLWWAVLKENNLLK